MSALRIVYVGHDFFSSCLSALISHSDIDVPLCITLREGDRRTANIERLAKSAGITLMHGPPTDDVVAAINETDVDLLVCGAYLWRIPVERLQVEWAVNIHPSLLPDGRGPNPIPYLVREYPEVSGVSIHEMTEELDKGPILLQERIGLDPDQGADELILRLFATAPRLLMRLLDDVPGTFERKVPQGEGSFWPEHTPIERTVAVATAPVAHVAEQCRRFGALDVIVELVDGMKLSGSRIVGTACDHDFATGKVLAEFASSTIIPVVDGLIRLDDPEPVPG